MTYRRRPVPIWAQMAGMCRCVGAVYSGFIVAAQACTEMVMPMCSNGTDMFEKSAWDLDAFTQKCARKWYVTDHSLGTGGHRMFIGVTPMNSQSLVSPFRMAHIPYNP